MTRTLGLIALLCAPLGLLCAPLGLLCAPLGAQASPELGERVREALDRARPRLLEFAREARAGHLALICLATVHDEVPADDPVFEKAIRRLAKERLRETYELSLRLMVMAELPSYPRRERAAKRDCERLLSNQCREGFGYGRGREQGDLSNTQDGALGLRAATQLGCEIPQESWRSMVAAVERLQARDGGFSYRRPVNPYSSMTVAGIAALEIGLQHVRLDAAATRRISKRIQRAWKWMADNPADVGSPAARHCYYFHYGLERAAILSGISHIGEVDWYERGAEMLLERQLADGGWSQANTSTPQRRIALAADPVATAFAVLFLRRKFRRIAGPVTLSGGYLTRGLPDGATPEQVARAVELDVARGREAIPELLVAMRSSNPARRKAAAAGLRRISGKEFGYDPELDPEESAAAIKAAERWWLTEGRRDDR